MPSEETKALFVQLFETILEASQFALRALVGGDEHAAQSFVASRDAVWKLSTEHMAISVLPRGVLAGELSV
jgi:Na+/phosphate symporter